MKRTLSLGLLLAGLATPAVAQIQAPVQKATTPQFAGVYHMGEGTLDRSATSPRLGPAVLFNNMILSGYYSVPGAGQEWIDEGGLLDRNAPIPGDPDPWDQINGFDFVYCSTEPDPTQNSGTISITFYDETVRCAGPPTWPTANCAYDIIGLPLGGATGNIQCWIVTVDLMCGFECPPDMSGEFRTEDLGVVDRLFGWGFIPAQNNTGPWLAKGGYRRDNSFTWFDPTTGAFIGCFWFGGFPFANFAMRLYGNPANQRYLNPPGAINPLCFSLDTEVIVGANVTFTLSPVDPNQWYWIVVSLADLPNPINLGAAGYVIIDPGQIIQTIPMGQGNGTVTLTIPGSASGLYVDVQLVCTSDSNPPNPGNVTGLSNAIWICIP